MIDVRSYLDLSGLSRFDRWFSKLDDTTQARIVIALDRLERGNFSTVKGVGSGVFELRMDFGPGYRIYFGKDGETVVILLGGGTKRRQQLDIEASKELWREFKQRKREEECH